MFTGQAIFNALGGNPGVLALAMILAQFVGKLIPEDATGAWGIVRKGAKVLGMYITNRQTNSDPVIGSAPANDSVN